MQCNYWNIDISVSLSGGKWKSKSLRRKAKNGDHLESQQINIQQLKELRKSKENPCYFHDITFNSSVKHGVPVCSNVKTSISPTIHHLVSIGKSEIGLGGEGGVKAEKDQVVGGGGSLPASLLYQSVSSNRRMQKGGLRNEFQPFRESLLPMQNVPTLLANQTVIYSGMFFCFQILSRLSNLAITLTAQSW